MGCFVVCLLEPAAAPGLTFKASNVAFQAAPEGGEHRLSREVIKAKCHVSRVRLETRSRAGASTHLRNIPTHSCSPGDKAVLSMGTLKASLTLKRQRAPRSAPKKHQKLGAHTTGTLLGRVCQEASNHSHISWQECFYLR